MIAVAISLLVTSDYTIKLDRVLYGTTGSDDLVGDGKSSYPS